MMRIVISVSKARLGLQHCGVESVCFTLVLMISCPFLLLFYLKHNVCLCVSNWLVYGEATCFVIYPPNLAQKELHGIAISPGPHRSLSADDVFASTCFVTDRPPSAHQTLKIGLQLASTQ